ncbi:MAG: CDP-alcohol phosphatidyltransferase family protein [Bacteroidetes bacterium]|nr:CDP-alcohol phosphatidyltransferase family protein [Bacteroidota bacterium]
MKLLTIPNIVTLLNMLCGILSILACLQGELLIAFYLLFTGAFFDFFDGFLARILKQPSEIGKQLDSLADAITFSAAPGFLVFTFLCFIELNEYIYVPSSTFGLRMAVNEVVTSWWSLDFGKMHLFPLIAFLIPAFSILRLAKFNIDERQTDSFIGLPTPANALFFASLVLFCSNNRLLEITSNKLIWSALIVVFSFLLISELKLFSLKFKTWGWHENSIRYVFLFLSLIIILLLNYASIAIIVFLYLVFSLVANYSKKTEKNEI